MGVRHAGGRLGRLPVRPAYGGDLDLMLLAPDGTPVQLTVADLDDDAENLIGNFPRDFTPLESLELAEPRGLNLTCGEGRLEAAW
jgi:hypothetical protein